MPGAVAKDDRLFGDPGELLCGGEVLFEFFSRTWGVVVDLDNTPSPLSNGSHHRFGKKRSSCGFYNTAVNIDVRNLPGYMPHIIITDTCGRIHAMSGVSAGVSAIIAVDRSAIFLSFARNPS
ncbi:MAG: hypothetical protein NTV84_08355, partial [Methanoregula sp.]|nr:hypothetical protein [Methanoregula sp.]